MGWVERGRQAFDFIIAFFFLLLFFFQHFIKRYYSNVLYFVMKYIKHNTKKESENWYHIFSSLQHAPALFLIFIMHYSFVIVFYFCVLSIFNA